MSRGLNNPMLGPIVRPIVGPLMAALLVLAGWWTPRVAGLATGAAANGAASGVMANAELRARTACCDHATADESCPCVRATGECLCAVEDPATPMSPSRDTEPARPGASGVELLAAAIPRQRGTPMAFTAGAPAVSSAAPRAQCAVRTQALLSIWRT